MPVALRQSQLDERDWITVADAAALTLLSERRWRQIATENLSRGLARASSPPSGGKPVWFLHRSLDRRLERCPDRDVRADRQRARLLAEFPERHVERAYRKFRWLNEWLTRCAERRVMGRTDLDVAADVVADAIEAEGPTFKISVRSLQSWKTLAATVDNGEVLGVRGLVDRYTSPPVTGGGDGGDSSGGIPPRSGNSPHAVGRSPEAIEFFYSLYRTQARHSVTVCHRATLAESKKLGWTWPTSVRATQQWLFKSDHRSATCLDREGSRVWASRYLPHVETDYASVEPGDFFVSDHHHCDIWVSEGRRQFRPWITCVQDLRSRRIVGWRMGPAAHQDSILAAFSMAFRECAIPRHARIDNGRDYTSKLVAGMTRAERDELRRELGAGWRESVRREDGKCHCVDPRWLGLLPELGVQVIFARPYCAWSKGTMERFFGTFEDQCGKLFATYCGNNTINRPEFVEKLRAGYTVDQRRDMRKQFGKDWRRVARLRLVDQSHVPSLSEARARFGQWLDVYHRTPHQGRGMSGASPLEAWGMAASLRRAMDDEVTFLAQTRGIYKVTGNGVSFRVGGDTVSFGRGNPAIAPFVGRELLVRLDPGDCSKCHVFTPDRDSCRFVATLTANEKIPAFTDVDSLREVIAQTCREQSVIGKSQRASARAHMSAAERLYENQLERRTELMATGTDHATPDVVVVRTGFEAASKDVRIAAQDAPANKYDDLDIDELLHRAQSLQTRNQRGTETSDGSLAWLADDDDE